MEQNSCLIQTARNQCKRLLINAKHSYTLEVQVQIKTQRHVSRTFADMINKILNRAKLSVPSIINRPAVNSSSSDQAKHFEMNVASRSTLILENIFYPNYLSYRLQGFSQLGKYPVLSKVRCSTKVTCLDKIPVFVLALTSNWWVAD